MTDIQKRFYKDILNIYQTAKRKFGYNASRFLQILSEIGGVKIAKKLIIKDEGTYRFSILYEHKRLDLSVEAFFIKDEYKMLFSDDEREMCKARPLKFDYQNKSEINATNTNYDEILSKNPYFG